jgi:ligand-binding SRPBCC domain-containing protein
MKIRELSRELWLPRPPEEIFPFFGEAANLEILTPPWLNFQILTKRPIEMRVGAIIDYRLRIHGVPLRWQSEITAWEPKHRFVDEQRRGPYRLWRHEHTFALREGGTVCRDHVRYAVAFDFLVHRTLVRPDIERIFTYRQEKLRQMFAPEIKSIQSE